MIVVVAEQRHGALDRSSWEAIAGAQLIKAAAPSDAITVAVLGADVAAAAAELSLADVDEVVTLRHPALEFYTPDAYTAVLADVAGRLAPHTIVLPHTYQTRDFAPKLAVRLGASIVTDVIGIKVTSDRVVFARPMYQGKLVADVVPAAARSCIVSLQVGSFSPERAVRRAAPAPVRALPVSLDPALIRQRPEPPFKETQQAVDLSRAERIVSVGRGIKEQANVVLAEKLAAALHAELAASRPICDAGWLPMDRQVGSSGQTVAPALYVAVGISGAIQHLVGMKGARTIVAINKDPDAPIFEVADYGIVGDLFEILPALTDALTR